ncbi:MAG: glucosaminidase domain-containing protein [Deferrisomatales bacterium]|nr:glucosaminidase domain-containing protein [Deferrisomatales bacterium]
MEHRSPSEEECRPGNGVSGLLLPALLCGGIVAMGLLNLGSRKPASWMQQVPVLAASPSARPGVSLLVFESDSARGLSAVLDAAWSSPGAGDAIPNLAPLRLPPDMDELDREAKKDAFFRALAPHVLAANRKIRADRARLRDVREHVRAGRNLTADQEDFLVRLADRYRVGEGGQGELLARGPEGLLEELWGRADVVPPSLALAQGAIESAWGSSRFARLGNSLFGQWVFSADKGMAPLFREEGANYSVARFVDIAEAVEAYMHNLNTLWAYEEFRAIRKGMRETGQPLDPRALAEGLLLYSVRREEYVEEVRTVVRDNRLESFDGRRLARLGESVWNTVLAELEEVPSFRVILLPE